MQRPRVVRHHRLQPGLVAGHAAAPSTSTSHVDDVERFFADDEHEATCTGWIDCDGLGERMAIAEGTLQPARRGRRAAPARDALPPVRPRSRRAPGDARGLQGGRGRLVSRHVGRHHHAVHAPVRGRVDARASEDGATAAGHAASCTSPRGGFLALMLEHARAPARQAALRLRSPRARCCRSTSGAARPWGRPTSPACTRARSAGRASRPRNGTTAPGGRACAGASWPCAPRTSATSPSTTSAARREPTAGPVLLSTAPACARTSSTARRCRARSSTSSSTQGYDVWLGNWRGSIDLPECDYTLDEVARYDHPALIAAVLRETGRADAQGDRPLPGLDVLRPGLRRRARARGDRRGLQRRVLPRRRPARCPS